MLENIALFISTALFFICTTVVNAVLPKKYDVGLDPLDEPAAITDAAECVAGADEAAKAALLGKWNSGGRILEFTEDGKLIVDGSSAAYTVENGVITATATVNGESRTYSLTIESLNERVICLNGINMYKVSD